LTYFIYNPYTSYTDDVLTRIDFIIDGCTIWCKWRLYHIL
jgi:hypothetical protein